MPDGLDAPQRLFGLPRRIDRDVALGLVSDLRERWELQHGRGIGSLEADLEAMRVLLFNPVAREERVRRELDRLRPVLAADPPDGAAEALLLDIGGAWVVTPEGRVAIGCLEQALAASGEGQVVIDGYDIHAAEHLLASTYASWVRYRLDRVISLRQGAARPMLPAAIATVLLLLFNGNVGVDRALRQPQEEAARELLDSAVTAPIEAFARTLEGGSRADPRHWSLYNGYALSEARRRLGSDLILERADEGGDEKRIYIAADAETRTIATLARELRARNLSASSVESAIDALLQEYELERPRLAAYSSVHARTSSIRRLRSSLLAQV